MYQLVVFIHVMSVVLFLLSHGVSIFVMFVMDRQENPENMRVLLALRESVSPVVAALSVLILVTGIIAAFMGNWWSMGWSGASVVLFIAIAIIMSLVGRRYFDRVTNLLKPGSKSDTQSAVGDMLPDALTTQIGHAPRGLLMFVGVGGIAVILWLMLFKPF
ncbi:MAG: DUF2269 domain-containing protein [Anaerolineae bacterium]|nr:DUF2269 domain-containing protein [Anaerolineae bacterium]